MKNWRTFQELLWSADAPQQLYVLADQIHFKVGISQDPHTRLAQLQTGCPTKLYVVFRTTLPVRCPARDLEKIMHEVLQPWKTDGGSEWFTICPEADAAFRGALRGWAKKHELKVGHYRPDGVFCIVAC